MTTFTNRKTSESAEFEVDVEAADGVATANGPGAARLFDLLTKWAGPDGVAAADFDMVHAGVAYHRCGVAGVLGPRGLTIDYMESGE